MIHKTCAFLVALALCSCQTQNSLVSDEVSASGLEYSLIKMPDNTRVSVQIAWPSHWAFDEDNNQAVPVIGSSLLVAGGAEGYSAKEAMERFEDMKSDSQLVSTAEYVLGTVHYSPEYQDETLKIVNAHLRSPTLDERWFERIRGQLSAQIKETRASPETKGFEAMRWAVFGKQPIRAAFSVDEANMIEDTTQMDVAEWKKSIFNRNSVSIVVAGDLDAEKANTVVDTIFEGIPVGDVIGDTSVDTDFSPKRILMHVPDAETSTLSFIGILPPSREGSEFEDILLTTSLGGGAQSVLFKAVRTKLRASYGYGAGISGFTRDHRILVLSGQVETSKIAEAEKIIRQSYTEFRANGPSGDLEQLKEPVRENLKKSMKDTGTMASAVLMAKLDGQDLTQGFSLQKELEAVTKQSLKERLTTSFPVIDDFMVVVSSPDAGALEKACVITSPEQAVDC